MDHVFIQKSDLSYEINRADLTAFIIDSPNARGDVFIPSLLKHELQEFKIIGVKTGSFKNSKKIKSITIQDESYLQSISKKAFSNSLIKKLNIPTSVNKLEDGWCSGTSKLKTVIISPSNKHFKYLDEKHQIIVEKSDPGKEIFDTIVFANRNIEKAIIPNHIQFIKPYAFENCEKLKTIEFSENSNLFSIGKKAFSQTLLKTLFIPPYVQEIEDGWCNKICDLKTVTVSPLNKHFKYLNEEHQIIIGKSDTSKEIFDTIIFANRNIKRAIIPSYIKYIKSNSFENCNKLKTIEISEDSELISLGKKVFSASSIENFFIPANTKMLDDKWCGFYSEIKTVTISPLNKHFKYLDEEHQIIIGKSDTSKEIFDTIIFANKDIERAIIPNYIKYIKPYSFKECKNLDLIEFQKDSELLEIGQRAFWETNLLTITIPKSVIKILSSAFFSCDNLQKVIFEEGSKLESIEKKLFKYNNNLNSIIIPENSSLKKICHGAFSSLPIKSIHISSSVEVIENYCFDDCSELKTVTVSPLNKHFKYLDEKHQIIVGKSDKDKDVFDTIIFANRNIKKAIIPNYIKYIKPCAFENCKSLLTIEFSSDSNLVYFDDNCFSNSSIQSLFIPESVEAIEDLWCNDASELKTVTVSPLNKHFKYLDEKHQIIVGKSDKDQDVFDTIIFANRNIKKIIIPNYIKYIKPYAFGKKLETIEFSKDSELVSIDYMSFNKSFIKEITIPKSVSKISGNAFNNCRNLSKISFEEGSKLRTLKCCAFSFNEELNSIEIPENSSLQKICCYSFNETIIQSFFIPKNVEIIEDSWCNDELKTVTISPLNKHFKYLDEEHQIIVGKSDKDQDAFDTIIFANRNIEHVIIPSSIKYIKQNSLENCEKLETIEFSNDSKIEFFDKNIFSSSLIENLFIPENVEELKDGWCSGTSKLKNVTISPSNKHFKYLDEKHQIIVEKSDPSKETFDTIAFANRNIEKAIIPNYIQYIKPYAFENCEKLKTIEFSIDSKLKKIGNESFSQSSIQSIIIPKSVIEIDSCAFSHCKDLSTFSLEEGSKLNSLKYLLFYSCNKLKTVNLPENSSLRYISISAFTFSSIEELFIPKNVSSIRYRFLGYNSELKTVTISPLNKHFKYLDEKHQIIVEKSDPNKDIFDTIIFADRNIKKAIIPNYIKYIKSNAFENCEKLNIIEISDGSEIESIGIYAFHHTSLTNFTVPRKINKYENYFLSDNDKLYCFEFLGDIFIDDKDESIFKELENSTIVSFPNIKELAIQSIYLSNNKFILLVSAGTDVSLVSCERDDKCGSDDKFMSDSDTICDSDTI